jgi:hypothetical protein
MAKKAKKMIQENLVKRLINTYTDCVVTDYEGELDFEETIFNFANRIINDMKDTQQKSVFGKVFESCEECYDYLENNVPSLRYSLELFVNDEQ